MHFWSPKQLKFMQNSLSRNSCLAENLYGQKPYSALETFPLDKYFEQISSEFISVEMKIYIQANDTRSYHSLEILYLLQWNPVVSHEIVKKFFRSRTPLYTVKSRWINSTKTRYNFRNRLLSLYGKFLELLLLIESWVSHQQSTELHVV